MKKIFTIVLCAFFALMNMNAAVYYVALDGNDANAGTSWATAVKDIQVAMGKAQSGDEIWVKAGEYTLTAHYIPGQTSGGEAGVWLKDGVSIYASFSGTETSKDQRVRTNATEQPWNFTNQTVILGGLKKDGTTPLRLFDRAVKADIYNVVSYIDGFTFRDWNAVSSRLLYLKENQVVRNCAFIKCRDNTSVLYFEDGGKVENTLFEGSGRPLYVRPLGGPAPNTEVRQTIEVVNCTFSNNTTIPLSIYSTAVTEDATPAVLVKGCKFTSNILEVSNPYVAATYYSAGIMINHSTKKRSVDVHDCVFENNENKDNGASAVMITSAGQVNFYNNILRNNKTNKADVVTGQTATFVLYQAPENGNIFNNLIVNNESNSGIIYAVQPIFFNNTVANNNGKMYFVNASVVFNNIFSKNHVDNVDKPVELDKGVFAMYMNNANTVNVTLAPSADDFVEDNVLFTNNAGFVSPTAFVGGGNIADIRTANYTLNATSQALSIGSLFLLGNEGLAYPQTWFDKYFQTDLAGNPRTNTNLIDAGAYQRQVDNSAQRFKSEKLLTWYADGNNVIIKAEKAGKIAVYNAQGRLILDTNTQVGITRLKLDNRGIYILKFNEGNQWQSFKVLVR